MDRFVIRKPRPTLVETPSDGESSKRSREEINLADLPVDPMDRKRLSDYNPNDREKVRRAYLLRGPYQPSDHKFPQTTISRKKRKFNVKWFKLYKPWLEYSVKGDAAYCLYCYLCADNVAQSDDKSFIKGGFRNWKKSEKFRIHIGGVKSSHNQCRRKCEDLMNQNQHIEHAFVKQTPQMKIEYEMRLLASIDCVRWCLHQGISFRAHDESDDSINMGNFKELHKFLIEHSEEPKKSILLNAPKNNKLTLHDIQVDIASACASETTKAIVEDIGDECFSILVDECRDVSTKEQMAIVIRYVNQRGKIVERFLRIIHVTDTCSSSLKEGIESLLSKHKLSMSRIRGQGYDGASNMRGEFNGLKSLILKDNNCAYYVHCFAHQLQLVLVAVAKNDPDVAWLFTQIGRLVNVVGGSCKRKDILREKQAQKIVEAMSLGEIENGRGLHQEYTLQRANDTRWSSHCKALINIGILFPSIVFVLGHVMRDGASSDQKGEAKGLLAWLSSFDFAFTSIMMKNILLITNTLALALQKKDLEIVNATELIRITKSRLQMMRSDGWESLFKEVSTFCRKYTISIPKMDDAYELPGRPRRLAHKVTLLHHYQIEIFKAVMDWILQELNNRFNEVTTELLVCMGCLRPNDSFSAFNKDKLIRLAELYPSEFSDIDRVYLDDELETYLFDMKSNPKFAQLKGIAHLASKLVKQKKHIIYPLVYRLIKLVLVLPVSTASVERSFSAMKIVKTRLRNKIGDEWMNDCLVTYIEKEVFESVSNDLIMQRFQAMANRRYQLPNKS